MRRRWFLRSTLGSLAAMARPLRVCSGAEEFTRSTDLKQNLRVGTPLARSNVPSVLRQGEFLPPQSVTALDISDDNRFVAVTTMAFRDSHNFWLVSADGKILWSRYVLSWAPFQVAALPGAGAFGVGLAYSRVTAPYPTTALFESAASEEKVLADVGGQLGWLRYGNGDWRTGWVTSMVGDLVVRSRQSLFTVPGEDGSWKLSADGNCRPYSLSSPRPFRMAASADGDFLALGYIAADSARMEEETRGLLSVSSAVLALRRVAETEPTWTVASIPDAPAPAELPDPAHDFPALAASFRTRPDALIPFRVAASVAVNRDASRVAMTEYGGWLWIRTQPAIGNWDPPYHVIPFFSPQRGSRRVFESGGREAARVEFPENGLFDLRMDYEGGVIWCVPMKWFARGVAGCTWLPTDRGANSVYAYDLGKRSWRAAWQFPDAVNDLAVPPGGELMLASCWDARIYSLDTRGNVKATSEAGGPAVVRWSGDGSFAIAGAAGELMRLDARGKVGWRLPLPRTSTEAQEEPLGPVFDGVPIYSVGRVGPEDAYVGDIWLIKLDQDGILVDAGGSSSIPRTRAKIRAAGLDPKHVRYLMHTHSHGDHVGAGYLWRAMGLKVVAPESAAYALSWTMPMLTVYGVWAPLPVDLPCL